MDVSYYSRVSTEEQKEGKNIKSQNEEIRTFINGNENYVLVKSYEDEGWSGGTLNRPALDRLRDDAGKGLFSAVIVNDVDRLSRDNTHLGIIIKDLKRKGVQVIFRKHPGEQSPQADLLVNLLGSFAEFEKAMITDRTRRGRRYKAEVSKQIVGSRPPYGYRYVRGDKSKGVFGRYEIIPTEAQVVKMMFDWVAYEKMTGQEVVRELTRRKIPTKNNRTKWGKSSVMRILHNETYIGTTYYNKQECVETDRHWKKDVQYRKQVKSGRRTRPKEEWIPIPLPESLRIVDNKTFQLVQDKIKNNLCFSKRNSQNQYLLQGLVRCGCGSPYHGTPCHGKLFYRCANRIKMFPERRTCFAPSISTSKLDTPVWQGLCQALENPKLIIEQVKKINASRYTEKDKIEDELKRLDGQIKGRQQEEGRMMEAYRQNVITLEQLRKENAKISQEKSVYEQERTTLLDKKNAIMPKDYEKSITEYCKTVKTRLGNLTFAEKQQVLRLLVSGINFQNGKVEVNAEIPLVDTQHLKTLGEGKNAQNYGGGNIRYISSCSRDRRVRVRLYWPGQCREFCRI